MPTTRDGSPRESPRSRNSLSAGRRVTPRTRISIQRPTEPRRFVAKAPEGVALGFRSRGAGGPWSRCGGLSYLILEVARRAGSYSSFIKEEKEGEASCFT